MNSIGMARLDSRGALVDTYEILWPHKAPKTVQQGIGRLAFMHKAFLQLLLGYSTAVPAYVVAIEGYGFASAKGNAIAELGGLLRHAAVMYGHRVMVFAPSAVQKFVTGKGGGHKDRVRLDVFRRWKFDHASEHVIDAYAVARVAEGMLSFEADRADGLTTFQREVVAKAKPLNAWRAI